MKKIISYSIWGNNPRYTQGAIQNAKLSSYYYPGWINRFYCGYDTPKDILKTLKNTNNTEIIIVKEPTDWTGMFWRFYAASDSDIMISRDSDSRISKREACAVNDWLSSNNDFHIMRDHPYHARPIMGGMWGCKNGILSNIKDLILNFNKINKYEIDQDFLSNMIYPIIKNRSTVHDPFYEQKPFPSDCGERISAFHIGQAYDGEGDVLDIPNYGRQSYIKYIKEYENIII